MGILADGGVIILGGLVGCLFQKFSRFRNIAILGVGIMIISVIGVVENLLSITDHQLQSSNLIIVILALMIGTGIGDTVKIHAGIENLESRFVSGRIHAFITGTLFFGIGGLQITGPVMLAAESDSTQLLLKSIIDLPFAITLGAACGAGIALSALPVMAVQLMIYFISFAAAPLLTADFISQISALGYIILFFVGFDLLGGDKRIRTVNMLPSILVLILCNAIKMIFEVVV